MQMHSFFWYQHQTISSFDVVLVMKWCLVWWIIIIRNKIWYIHIYNHMKIYTYIITWKPPGWPSGSIVKFLAYGLAYVLMIQQHLKSIIIAQPECQIYNESFVNPMILIANSTCPCRRANNSARTQWRAGCQVRLSDKVTVTESLSATHSHRWLVSRWWIKLIKGQTPQDFDSPRLASGFLRVSDVATRNQLTRPHNETFMCMLDPCLCTLYLY